MGEPLLVLDAVVPDRPFIEIKSNLHPEGKRYELRVRSELSVFQLQTVQSRGEAAVEMQKKYKDEEEYTQPDLEQLQSWQHELLDIALATPMEPEVLKGLDLFQKSQIVMAFNYTCFGIVEEQEKPTPATTRPRKKKEKVTGA
jgi:hypothetical protein